jgi:CRISPR/Cas system-associated protein Cas10 (large subunit of type III CRISPR-Cas system)
MSETSVSIQRKPGRPPKQAEIVEESVGGVTLEQFLDSPLPAIRKRYREELSKSESLEELARFRAICQAASEEINQRLIPDEDECAVCHRIIASGTKVPQMIQVKDQSTGIVQTKVLCSIGCIREYNRGKMGLAELVK